jgi:hypothetical protein
MLNGNAGQGHQQQSLEELRRGELEFSSDPARLRQMLED